jgi:DGQHR domain-containing protein
MSENSWIRFPAIEVEQPIGLFYIGVIRAPDLVEVAHADIRRIEERDIEKTVGIERPLSVRRVKEISQYVTTIDATFPTSIILAIDSRSEDGDVNIAFDKAKRELRIRRANRVAQIIDGQHRIAGLDGFSGTFDLNVAIFVDMDLEDKGNVFATINLQQTKVSKSLAYDLYEYAQSRSPQKTAHNIARLFCAESGSPFENRIKILGCATGGDFEFLTQAAFVDRLLPMISSDPMDDRDRLKRGVKLSRPSAKEAARLVFRNLFIDAKDADIARILWNFFGAVAERWSTAWHDDARGNILPRTSGFAALMRFLPNAYRSFGRPDQIVKKSEFRTLLQKVRLRDSDFSTDNYKPGTSGETKLYADLRQCLPDDVDPRGL